MTRIVTQLPEPLLGMLDAVATELERSREDLIREAVQQYLEDFNDHAVALERLRDENDPELDWECVKRDLLEDD